MKVMILTSKDGSNNRPLMIFTCQTKGCNETFDEKGVIDQFSHKFNGMHCPKHHKRFKKNKEVFTKSPFNLLVINIKNNHKTYCYEAIVRNESHVYGCYSRDMGNGGMYDSSNHHFFGYYEGKALDVIRYLDEKFNASHGWHMNGGGGYMTIYSPPEITKV